MRIIILIFSLLIISCVGPVRTELPCPSDDCSALLDLDANTEGAEGSEDAEERVDEDIFKIFQWGTPQGDSGVSVIISGDGSVFVTGGTEGSLNGNQSLGNRDIFVTKFSHDLDMKWTKQWGTEKFDQGYSIAADSLGNIFVTGWYDGIYDPTTKFGIGKMFVSKLDSEGVEVWNQYWGTLSQEYSSSAAVDNNGNIYISGWTYGSFSGGASSGSSDLFLSKFTADGVDSWDKQWGTGFFDYAIATTVDKDGSIYVVGDTYGAFEGNVNEGMSDIVLTKYDSSGNMTWIREFGSFYMEYAFGMATDSSGNIFVAGSTEGSLGGFSNKGGNDAFLAKLDTDGNNIWTYMWGTEKTDAAMAVVVDKDGNIYVAGITEGSFEGFQNAGRNDIFLTKVSPDGLDSKTVMWGSPLDDIAYAMTSDDNRIYITGWTEGALGDNQSAGNIDIFLLAMSKPYWP